jgi:hypothetical protein
MPVARTARSSTARSTRRLNAPPAPSLVMSTPSLADPEYAAFQYSEAPRDFQ